jgi:hypothetical protein
VDEFEGIGENWEEFKGLGKSLKDLVRVQKTW